ncbi:hypothetical protein FN846DRAFT_887866 [Sphaerosporella brunnea]|uniref:Uncharacterized protein n=1 Tax=Sphaerosporella brunnea TaxID=1250544 RepID=A0A5J5F4S7_9PEZI|nr:hypothetical protein FN846DRAFT_887866 [Sphaerosporella brunnea]
MESITKSYAASGPSSTTGTQSTPSPSMDVITSPHPDDISTGTPSEVCKNITIPSQPGGWVGHAAIHTRAPSIDHTDVHPCTPATMKESSTPAVGQHLTRPTVCPHLVAAPIARTSSAPALHDPSPALQPLATSVEVAGVTAPDASYSLVRWFLEEKMDAPWAGVRLLF